MATLVMSSLSIENPRNSCENQIQSQLPEMVSRRLAIVGRSCRTMICNGFKILITRWIKTYIIDLVPKISIDPKMSTTSNFAPMDECLLCNDVEIVGTFSSYLNVHR
jgi:hypothetical protein